MPALWRVPGMLDPELIGADLTSVRLMDPLEYCARVLGKICEGALSFRFRPAGQVRELLGAPRGIVDDHGQPLRDGVLPAADIVAMRQKAQFNAKEPQLHFESDNQAKRNRGRSAHRRCPGGSAGLASRLHQRLECSRTEQEARTEQNYRAS